MSPTADAGNLIWNTLAELRTPVIFFLFVYATLVILLPSVYQFVRCRRLAKAEQDLAKRQSEVDTPSPTEPVCQETKNCA
jgi:hypothetical protein